MISRAIEAIEDEPLLHYVRGQVLMEAGRHDEAIDSLEASIDAFGGAEKHTDAIVWLRRALRTARAKQAEASKAADDE